MSGIESTKIEEIIVQEFEEGLDDNLAALILIGSYAVGDHQDDWSDVDLLVAVDQLNITTKRNIAVIKSKLEDEFGLPFGINTVKKSELLNPLDPVINLDGKTLQALLELSLKPERLIYSHGVSAGSIFIPSRDQVKAYCFSNIQMFKLRNRKTLTSKLKKETPNLKKLTAKELRAGFIMTKLGVQYFSDDYSFDHNSILDKAEKLFDDFDISSLRKNLEYVESWSEVNDRGVLGEILASSDEYIESFSAYVTSRVNN